MTSRSASLKPPVRHVASLRRAIGQERFDLRAAVGAALLLATAWAAVANSLVRNYYGYFIHADLPWTYGRLGKVFVSPSMHQWHHAKDIKYAGTNFATVFSIFDRVFGTFALPGPCTVPGTGR